MSDFPLPEIIEAMERHVAAGNMVWFKFTCVHCGSRQTDSKANTIHRSYTCEDCGKETFPTEGNFMLAVSTNPEKMKELLGNKG
jgi:predicted RNA-binding Zn-ribbon protein involved in translation (DUF1610 family)